MTSKERDRQVFFKTRYGFCFSQNEVMNFHKALETRLRLKQSRFFGKFYNHHFGKTTKPPLTL